MKRVNFKKIVIKNFLSVGEEPVTVDFVKGLHVITGSNKDKPDRRNAIGKSTIADSVYFAIFGETLREIKKDLIPNNVTGGKTHVELDFEVITPSSTKEYKIVRTLSPTKVEIYEDNIDKTHDSIANTTKYISDILSASTSIFKNCVIMTVNNAIPFMAKTKIEKRKFIEDIFGLEVFSEMISKLRSEYNDAKRDFDNQQTALREVELSYNNYNNQRNKILEERKAKKELYITRRDNNERERKDLLELIESTHIQDVVNITDFVTKCEQGIEKCDEKINNLTAEIAVSKQTIINHKDAYKKMGTSDQTCPVCLREIKDHDLNFIEEEKLKVRNIIETEAENTTLKNREVEELTAKKIALKNKITALNAEITKVSLQQQDLVNKRQRVTQLEAWLEELEEDLKNIDNTTTDFDEVISSTKLRLDTLQQESDSLRKQLNKLDVVKYIISEEGVKSYIVNKLLELLNSRLLYYLQRLDSNSICIFNEYFEEEILNEKNKVCSYFNFSGAERKSIDLACLFAFSDLRRMQGGVHYNLTMYDELFDSSFDEKGIELITDILKDRVDDLNECTMVISHRKESIKAVTGDVIFLEKENGITRRVEYLDI